MDKSFQLNAIFNPKFSIIDRNLILCITIFVISILSISCQRKGSQIENVKILISEPLLNRVIDNGEKHDRDCVGFYTHHFAPSLIDTSYFRLDALKSLKKKTGIKWDVLTTTDSVINFLHIFTADDDTNRVVYLAEMVESDSSETKILSVGSDDGFILWVNGDSIASMHKGRQLLPHDDIVPVNLRKGKNILLFKIDQGTGDWALYRKFISVQKMKNVLLYNVSELYSDMPEWCIISDSSTLIGINPENGRNLDSMHVLYIGWKNMDDRCEYIGVTSYMPYELPETLPLPAGFSGKAIFEIKVVNKSGEIDFREEIPIFIESEANRLAKRLTESPKKPDDPVYITRRDAVIEMFNINKEKDAEEYSTRMKAHALLDLYRYELKLKDSNQLYSSGPRVWGYRSLIDSTIQPYRLFFPSSLCEQPDTNIIYNVVFIMRWVAEDDREFWKTQQAKSHWRMVKRAGYSTYFQSILVMTHGRGIQNYSGDATEEFPLILSQLKKYWKIDTTNISLFAHSNGPIMALNLMCSVSLPISNLGLWSPILPDDDTKIHQVLIWIKKDYPELRWFIWQGAEDERASVSVTRKWVDMIRKIHFMVQYKEESHSTHFVYLGDPEKEFYRLIKK